MFSVSSALRHTAAALFLVWLSAITLSASAEDGQVDLAAGTERCRDCHDYAPTDHVERLLMGSHGISEEAGFTRGCEDCHGASAAHADAPREVPPATTFGPRWEGNSAAQDAACLNCHEENSAADWRHALHMHNNLTCVTCHDIHSSEDKVLLAEQQAGVCTTCHEAKKAGIHNRNQLTQDPPCSDCHNPHNHEMAQPQMQTNQSAGCRHCHDLTSMADDPLVSSKARNYHQALQEPQRTCADCHQGISHESIGPAVKEHPAAEPTPGKQGL